MKIAVISEIEASSALAHAINVVKTAGGFARKGHEVRVFCRPPADGAGTETLGARYAEPALGWCLAPPSIGIGDHAALGRWAVDEATAWGAGFVYGRHYHAPVFAADAGVPSVLETHAHAESENPALDAACAATARGPLVISTISRRLAADYIRRGAAESRVIVTPDGVDVELFEPPEELERSALPLARFGDGPHALYAGHLYDYKGVPTVLNAAALIPELRFHLLGGLPGDIDRMRSEVRSRGLRNVLVHGSVAHAEVPRWLWGASVLVLPPSARHPSAAWTSPLKLGEYLAAGPPVVASSIPALRDWVDEPAVRWFEPDDGASLARAIGAAIGESDPLRAARRAQACELARSFSYAARAEAMLRAAMAAARHAGLQGVGT